MNHSRILVVDDEPQLRRALKSTLSALGFLVADAATGEGALEMLRAEKFDLMLLDINMPGLDGIETCRAVRARSDMGIVMLTVRGRAEDKIRALDSGADGYVTKPFDVNELLARIRATLRRTPADALGESRVFRPEGVEINFRERHVTQGTRTTRLTPKESELLHFFVTHPNEVLPARADSSGGLGSRLWRRSVSISGEYLSISCVGRSKWRLPCARGLLLH